MFSGFELIEFAAWILLPPQTVGGILNLERNSQIEDSPAVRSSSLTCIRRSFKAVSFGSFFDTFYTDHIKEEVSHSSGLLIVNVLQTIVKLCVTEAVGFCVEIKIEETVFPPERFDLDRAVVVAPAAPVQLLVGPEPGEVPRHVVDSAPEGPCTARRDIWSLSTHNLTWEDSSGQCENVDPAGLLLLRVNGLPDVGVGQVVAHVNRGHDLLEVHLHHRHLLGVVVEQLDLVLVVTVLRQDEPALTDLLTCQQLPFKPQLQPHHTHLTVRVEVEEGEGLVVVIDVGSSVLGRTGGARVTIGPPLGGEAEAGQAGEEEGVDQDHSEPSRLTGEEGGGPHLTSYPWHGFSSSDWSV